MNLQLVLGEGVAERPCPLGPLLVRGDVDLDVLAEALAFGPVDAIERGGVDA